MKTRFVVVVGVVVVGVVVVVVVVSTTGWVSGKSEFGKYFQVVDIIN